jgi:hypothetical protein
MVANSALRPRREVLTSWWSGREREKGRDKDLAIPFDSTPAMT